MFYSVVTLLFLAPISVSSQVAGTSDEDDLFRPLQSRRGLYGPRMASVKFGYTDFDGPSTWKYKYRDCGGPYQSPINIETEELEYRNGGKPLKWANLCNLPDYVALEKSDVSLGMRARWKNPRDIPYLSGGPLMERYYFNHFHFHWNTSSNAGSEHSIDGTRYPMEIHAVYTSNPGGEIEESEKIVVIGFMVMLSYTDNPAFHEVIKAAKGLKWESTGQTRLSPFPLKNLGLDFCADYVIYRGSLTTPPCTGGITWIISSRSLPLSVKQYKMLKSAVSLPGRSFSANTRPVQEINGRKIYYVVAPDCKAERFEANCP